ncbi:MAG TPA: hypothetical protein VN639_12225 [Azonexus sp.]|nr:hypothetical protein [Azonexus sp.]
MTTPPSIPDPDYRETAENLRRQAIARLNHDLRHTVVILPQPEETQQSVHEEEKEHSDKRLLKYFFWFSLVLSSFFALVAPSGATTGIVLSVIGLGIPLFSAQPKGKSKSPNNDSTYGLHVSKPWWLFIAFSTLVMPFVFGWRLGKDPALFFVLAFFGLAIGTIVLMVTKLSSHSKR